MHQQHRADRMPWEDYKNLTDKDYDNLPPLVPKGADREAILSEVVEKWATQTMNLETKRRSFVRNAERFLANPATLKKVAMRDDNPGAEAIDLGELIARVEKCLAKRTTPDPPADQTNKPRRSYSVITLVGCDIDTINTKSIEMTAHLTAVGCRIRKKADFSNAVFLGGIDFSHSIFKPFTNFGLATFKNSSCFQHTTFSSKIDFSLATFTEKADFRHAVCKEYTDFSGATFNDNAHFDHTDFERHIKFNDGKFIKITSFFDTTFYKPAYFSNANFRKSVDFRKTIWSSDTYFNETTFEDQVVFKNARFNGCVSFNKAKFMGDVRFDHAVFNKGAGLSRITANKNFTFPKIGSIHLQEADLRKARIEKMLISQVKNSGLWKRFRLRCTDWLMWKMVQQLGGLQVLTRASYWALVIVPLVAAVWPLEQFIRDLFGAPATQSGVMSLSWVLLYLAALCVFFGQLVYQLACPETIKQKSVEKLIEDAEEKTRQDKGISDERLRTAIDALQSVANVIPHKHNAWLVTRSRRTVWLPHELELYEDATVDDTQANPVGESPPDDPQFRQIPATQEIRAEDRKRIAIEEGERAQWAMQAYRNRFAAWLSGGLYILGGWFVAAILLMQAAAVADAAGSHGLKILIDTYRDPVLWWGSWGLLVAVILGIAMASDTPWEKLSRWIKGVRAWLQAQQKWFAGKDKPKH